MSRSALLVAVRDAIRANLEYDEHSCDLTIPGGYPHPNCGSWFVGVWAGNRRNQGRGWCLDMTHDVTVTLTARIQQPYDRLAQDLMVGNRVNKGLYDRVDEIVDLIHKDSWNFHVTNRANQIIGDPSLPTYSPLNSELGDEPVGFREGLTFLEDNVLANPVDGSWFRAGHGKKTHSSAKDAGVVVHMRFGKSRLIRTMANVTNVDILQ